MPQIRMDEKKKIMRERETAFFRRKYCLFCFSSPGRGDFTTGEEEDSKVGFTIVSLCCFGGVPTNPSPLSADTNHGLLATKRHQLSNYFIYNYLHIGKCLLKIRAMSHKHLCYSMSPYPLLKIKPKIEGKDIQSSVAASRQV